MFEIREREQKGEKSEPEARNSPPLFPRGRDIKISGSLCVREKKNNPSAAGVRRSETEEERGNHLRGGIVRGTGFEGEKAEGSKNRGRVASICRTKQA